MPAPRAEDRAPWVPDAPARPASGAIGLRGLPGVRLHRVACPRWPGPALRIAVLADPHVCRPWVTPERISDTVAQTQALGADLIVLAGDFLPDRKMPCRHLTADAIVPLFAGLSAPLGVWSIMGNHDYADCPRALASDGADSSVAAALAAAGLPLLRNGAVALEHGGCGFWLVGLDSQRGRGRGRPGYEDPERAFADVPAGAPAILLAHEPDYFARGDDRALLQISGHTHGGQGVILGRRPMTPSAYGDRYAIGHIAELDRHLVVSAGLGYSGLPLRVRVPPELTCIELRGAPPPPKGDD